MMSGFIIDPSFILFLCKYAALLVQPREHHVLTLPFLPYHHVCSLHSLVISCLNYSILKDVKWYFFICISESQVIVTIPYFSEELLGGCANANVCPLNTRRP